MNTVNVYKHLTNISIRKPIHPQKIQLLISTVSISSSSFLLQHNFSVLAVSSKYIFFSYSFLNLLHSGFCHHHPVLVKVTNDFPFAKFKCQFFVPILLDLSATFDMVDHSVLPDTLFHFIFKSQEFAGFPYTPLVTLQSYLLVLLQILDFIGSGLSP